MAHTLSITYGETPTTISLSDSGASAGIALGDGQGEGGYQPSEVVRDVTYNASLYQDGDRPVFDRAANIRETFTVTIRGSSVDDMLSRLRSLKTALWQARDYFRLPAMRSPAYLSFKPSGSTNTAYSTIIGGDVQEPDMLQSEIVNYTIHNVRVTIEREPFWRDKAPVRGVDTAYYNALIYPTKSDANNYNAYPYGSFYIDGSTYAAIPGDIPALSEVKVSRGALGPAFGKFWAGYRSEMRYPPTRGAFTTFQGGAIEASSWTDGTDCSNTTDTALDPGTGNTGKQITFNTKTNAARMTVNLGSYASPTIYLPVGSYRVFVKWKSATANPVTAYLSYYFAGSTPTTTSPVTVTVPTTDQVDDLGVITWARGGSTMIDPGATALALGVIDLYMSATNTYTLKVDHLFFIPCDEYYLSLSGSNVTYTTGMVRASTLEPAGLAYPIQVAPLYDTSNTTWDNPTPHPFGNGGTGSGALYLPPGKGRLFYICADATNACSYSATKNMRVYLSYVARYLSARGAG